MVPAVGETSTEGLRGEKLVFCEVTVVVRVTAEDSGGAMTVLEEVPPMVDTPLHVHSREDELFYIADGEQIVQRGDEEFRLGPDAYAAASEKADITWLLRPSPAQPSAGGTLWLRRKRLSGS